MHLSYTTGAGGCQYDPPAAEAPGSDSCMIQAQYTAIPLE